MVQQAEQISTLSELLSEQNPCFDEPTFQEIAFLMQQCEVTYQKQPSVSLSLVASRLNRVARTKHRKFQDNSARIDWLKEKGQELFQPPNPEISKILSDVNLTIYKGKVTALIGPSGAGKSTLLKLLNRMLEVVPKGKTAPNFIGNILKNHGGQYVDIYQPDIDPIEVRRRVGMIFQLTNPLLGTVWQNVTYGLRMMGITDKKVLDELAEIALKEAFLWDEVKNSLHRNAKLFSGGQQQRMSIARTLALQPEVILMDEPCSSLDPIATKEIEDVILELKKQGHTLLIVTHNMRQAKDVSDFTGVMMKCDATGKITSDSNIGAKVVQFGPTEEVFIHPANRVIADFMAGRWG